VAELALHTQITGKLAHQFAQVRVGDILGQDFEILEPRLPGLPSGTSRSSAGRGRWSDLRQKGE
jgi:hypothetical protein